MKHGIRDPSAGRKVALVTGGGRRIGAAISEALARGGYVVVPTYLSSRREAGTLASGLGGKAFRLDLSRPSTFASPGEPAGEGIRPAGPPGPQCRRLPADAAGVRHPCRMGRGLRGESPRPAPADPVAVSADGTHPGRRGNLLHRGCGSRADVAFLSPVLPFENRPGGGCRGTVEGRPSGGPRGRRPPGARPASAGFPETSMGPDASKESARDPYRAGSYPLRVAIRRSHR